MTLTQIVTRRVGLVSNERDGSGDAVDANQTDQTEKTEKTEQTEQTDRPDHVGPLARRKRALGRAMGVTYVVAGVAHFLAPNSFARAVPPELPRPRALVYLSGVAEVLLGVGMQFDRTRRASAWGIVALLVAVFPANVYMATDDVAAEFVPDRLAGVARVAAWARLPVQALLVFWAWWHALPDSHAEREAERAERETTR